MWYAALTVVAYSVPSFRGAEGRVEAGSAVVYQACHAVRGDAVQQSFRSGSRIKIAVFIQGKGRDAVLFRVIQHTALAFRRDFVNDALIARADIQIVLRVYCHGCDVIAARLDEDGQGVRSRGVVGRVPGRHFVHAAPAARPDKHIALAVLDEREQVFFRQAGGKRVGSVRLDVVQVAAYPTARPQAAIMGQKKALHGHDGQLSKRRHLARRINFQHFARRAGSRIQVALRIGNHRPDVGFVGGGKTPQARREPQFARRRDAGSHKFAGREAAQAGLPPHLQLPPDDPHGFIVIGRGGRFGVRHSRRGGCRRRGRSGSGRCCTASIVLRLVPVGVFRRLHSGRRNRRLKRIGGGACACNSMPSPRS